MRELKDLAIYAAQNSIRGTSAKRNSLLKPFDIILDELEHYSNPATKEEQQNELALIQAGTKGLIFEHLERIAKTEFKPGRTKQGKVNQYVDSFFGELLAKAHHGNVNRLLAREKLLRSAYLVYYCEAWADVLEAKGKAKEAVAVADAAEIEIDVEVEGDNPDN